MNEGALHSYQQQPVPTGCPSTGEPSPDAELLARFTRCRNEPAFEELVRRHGPMVMGVCRRVLNDSHDSEDAFQATFLVLAQKASSIRKPELLGNWLYGVAYRTARKAKRSKPKSIAMPAAEPATPQPGLEVALRELQSVVDEELHRLPHRDQLLLTMCYFQGLTHLQVADRLGWRQGSVSRRLAKARELLQVRLTRRGLTMSIGLFALLLEMGPSTVVSAALIESTARASAALAAGSALDTIVPLRVAALARRIGIAPLSVTALVLASLLLLGPCGLTTNVGRTSAASATAGDASRVMVVPTYSTGGKAFNVHDAEDADTVVGCH